MHRGLGVVAMLLERDGAPKSVEVLVFDDGVPRLVAMSVGGGGVEDFELVVDPVDLVPRLLYPLKVQG